MAMTTALSPSVQRSASAFRASRRPRPEQSTSGGVLEGRSNLGDLRWCPSSSAKLVYNNSNFTMVYGRTPITMVYVRYMIYLYLLWFINQLTTGGTTLFECGNRKPLLGGLRW